MTYGQNLHPTAYMKISLSAAGTAPSPISLQEVRSLSLTWLFSRPSSLWVQVPGTPYLPWPHPINSPASQDRSFIMCSPYSTDAIIPQNHFGNTSCSAFRTSYWQWFIAVSQIWPKTVSNRAGNLTCQTWCQMILAISKIQMPLRGPGVFLTLMISGTFLAQLDCKQ